MTKATPISTLVPYTTLFRSPMQRIRALEGSHPLPDANSLASTYELIDLATKIPDGSLVFYLLSGGSSALLCRPADELELDDLVATHQLLLTSGANIHEMNVVRTALSKIGRASCRERGEITGRAV